MARVLAVLTLVLLLVPTAATRAAEPPAGEVGPGSPSVGWRGTLTGPTVVADLPYAATGGTHGTCTAPLCDTFSLTLRDGGEQTLYIRVESVTPATNVSLEVVLPTGRREFRGSLSPSTAKTLEVPEAPDGRYTIRVSAGSIDGTLEIKYKGIAQLGDVADCVPLRRYDYESGGEPLAGAPVDDPLYRSMHGHPLMNVEAAWARGGLGQGTTIAVLDTGIDLAHPDLQGNLVEGVDMLEGEDTADCAPGPWDDNGHGTHVAGLAAGVADNGIGIAGVAPRASIMPVKVCPAAGDCPRKAIEGGIRWAVDHGADVINLSLGGDEISGPPWTATYNWDFYVDDVAYATERGVVVVAAAGNSSWAFCGYPAAVPGAICVAAVDRRGVPTPYSNQPFDRDGDIQALRAFGGGTVYTDDGCTELAISTGWPGAGQGRCGRAYVGMAGTSMASPEVAGAAAILRSLGVPGDEVTERLLATASNGGDFNPVMGYGIPDLDAATRDLGR